MTTVERGLKYLMDLFVGWILGDNCRKEIEIFNGSLHGLDPGLQL